MIEKYFALKMFFEYLIPIGIVSIIGLIWLIFIIGDKILSWKERKNNKEKNNGSDF